MSQLAGPDLVAGGIPASGVAAGCPAIFALDNFRDGGVAVVSDVATAIVGNVGSARCWADVGLESEASDKELRVALGGRTVSAVRTGRDWPALLGIERRNGFEAVRGPVVAALWDHYLQGASVIQVDLAVSPDRRSVMAGLALPTE